MWCLQLGFVHCVQPRLNVTEQDILKTLFDSTGGSTGRWNYAGMKTCLTQHGGSIVIGRDWNFTKNAAGAYLEDPSQNDATSTKPFTGVYCACDAALCAVEYLLLPCGDLSGPIPEALGNLAQLQDLWLFSNLLTGPIPEALGDLAQLQGLDLSGNLLTGPIPEALGDLAQLQYLYLDTNSLTGPIPETLGDLAKLQDLGLASN
jgi:hypothetical protein